MLSDIEDDGGATLASGWDESSATLAVGDAPTTGCGVDGVEPPVVDDDDDEDDEDFADDRSTIGNSRSSSKRHLQRENINE